MKSRERFFAAMMDREIIFTSTFRDDVISYVSGIKPEFPEKDIYILSAEGFMEDGNLKHLVDYDYLGDEAPPKGEGLDYDGRPF